MYSFLGQLNKKITGGSILQYSILSFAMVAIGTFCVQHSETSLYRVQDLSENLILNSRTCDSTWMEETIYFLDIQHDCTTLILKHNHNTIHNHHPSFTSCFLQTSIHHLGFSNYIHKYHSTIIHQSPIIHPQQDFLPSNIMSYPNPLVPR